MFKKFAIAAAAIALTAGAASANNTFGLLNGFDQDASYYDVNLARTLGEGSVQIENLSGDVIGTASLNEGTNTDVRVNFKGNRAQGDVVAKLIVDGVVVDEELVQVSR